MPAVQCPSCKAHISVPGLYDCPLCKGPLPTPFVEKKNAVVPPPVYGAAPSFTASKPTSQSARNVLVLAGAGALVFCVGVIIYSVVFPSAEKQRKAAIGKALVACQYAIKALAQYGNADLPPYVPNHARSQDDEFYFAWPRGSFEFANGFGAREKMSASCTGTLSTSTIKSLTVNGKDVI